jgi:hypothetical protein
MRVRDADDHLEIIAHARKLASLLHHLRVAAGVGVGARLFISVGYGQYQVGDGSRLGQEHVLHHDKAVWKVQRDR